MTRLPAGHVLEERYQVIRPLGAGRDGFVYLCEDLRIEGKSWALRESPNLADFEEQVRFLAAIVHPVLPLVADHFVWGERAYLVCEFIGGVELAKKIVTEGPVEPMQAFCWGREIADLLALLENQSQPLQLRNLSPPEVLVLPDRSIRLVNLGLSALGAKPKPDVERFEIGFAAPELWAGAADSRADLYSLGALIYFAATGTVPPYRDPTRPPDLTDPQWEVLRRCLEPEPEQRGRASEVMELFLRAG